MIERYDRRRSVYSPLDCNVYLRRQELERALVDWFNATHFEDPGDVELLEIGCGHGSNLQLLIRLGFSPSLIVGNELLNERAVHARSALPQETKIVSGDALDLAYPEHSFDVVFQSLVFSSILDDATQQNLATLMWNLARPGGGVLWYDFFVDNPANPDVRGVSRKRICELFPGTVPRVRKITLAPPISRIVTRASRSLYAVFNAVPLFRTHYLCWIPKPR